ncbi:hypothetical protein J6590_082665 [Homalodisca vitripennis]|nr:hypothetical protein J6590_082665 [Homalodisca vitripennis]
MSNKPICVNFSHVGALTDLTKDTFTIGRGVLLPDAETVALVSDRLQCGRFYHLIVCQRIFRLLEPGDFWNNCLSYQREFRANKLSPRWRLIVVHDSIKVKLGCTFILGAK